MKKLLMLGAILVIGAVAYGAPGDDDKNNEAEAKVTVKAELVAQNLVISDLQGNPIVLDFEKVNKTLKEGTKQARVDYKVEYVGDTALTDGTNKLAMKLQGEDKNYVDADVPVKLSAIEKAVGGKENSFEATVGLNSYAGVMPTTGGAYTGTVYGTIDFANVEAVANGTTETGLANLPTGHYEGFTMLKVTINDGKEM